VTSPLARALAVLAVALAAAAPLPAGGVLSVVDSKPARHANDAPRGTAITLTFDLPVAPRALDSRSARIFGRWSGVAPGAWSLDAGGTVATFQPARPFFPGEQVTLQLCESVAGAAGEPLPGGWALQFFVRPARGTGNLVLADVLSTRLEDEPPVRSYGIYAGDLDGDGAPDLSIPNETADDVRVLVNDGCGTFAGPDVYPLGAGTTPSANEGHDLDGDGDVDFAVANTTGDSLAVLMGTGAGGYTGPTTYASGDDVRAVAVLDADADGAPDVVTANREDSNLALFVNAGDGSFPAGAQLFEGGGDGETGLAAGDADGDGRLDLLVACRDSDEATILLGDGAGGFALAGAAPTGADPWTIVTGDLDGDGVLDAGTSDSLDGTATLLFGDGSGGVTGTTTLPTGAFPIAIDLGDLEGDGDLDVVVSSFFDAQWNVFHNAGDGTFEAGPVLQAASAGSCATLVDYDRDGFLDLAGVDEIEDEVRLFRQGVPVPLGVQPAACAATLRIDNAANVAGFGGQLPHAVAPGQVVFVGVTAEPRQGWTLIAGVALAPGAPLPAGLLNVAPPVEPALAASTDAAGESLLAAPLPGRGLPAGLALTLQVAAGTADGTLALSNPETIQVQ